MKKIARLSIIVILVILIAALTTQAAVWSSSDQWATWSNGGYTLYNNIWGSGAGPQTIWANSYSNWGVWANHPNTGGVKSYPNCEKVVNRRISALGSCVSSFSCTRPSSGAYCTAYDIWCDNYTYEIMLWMNKQGAVGPLGASQGSATVGGHSWTVYKGSNGSNQVFSFIRTSNTNSGTVNIKDILNWIKNTKKWFGDVTLYKVQLGWEITSSSPGLDFQMNSYSVSFN
ncbi:MAG: hypothetical protein K6U80_06275 [Firmicutes bacterium]|nr:hypothetical protein [Bacillota bacterium]